MLYLNEKNRVVIDTDNCEESFIHVPKAMIKVLSLAITNKAIYENNLDYLNDYLQFLEKMLPETLTIEQTVLLHPKSTAKA